MSGLLLGPCSLNLQLWTVAQTPPRPPVFRRILGTYFNFLVKMGTTTSMCILNSGQGAKL